MTAFPHLPAVLQRVASPLSAADGGLALIGDVKDSSVNVCCMCLLVCFLSIV